MRIANSSVLSLFFAMILMYNVALGQNTPNFIKLTTKNGLSSNTVNAILQDRNGLTWFGTNDGLNKFDGTNFTVYTNKSKDGTSIPSNNITALLEDRLGRLWIGTSSGGLCIYDSKKNQFTSFTGDGIPGRTGQFNVLTLYEDNSGNIWVGTFGGYRIINSKTLKVKNVGINTFMGNGSSVLSFSLGNSNKMWVGTNVGLLAVDLKSGITEKFIHNPSDPNSLSNNSISTIIKDESGRIYFGTNRGLNMLINENGQFKAFLQPSSNKLSDNVIYDASLAKQGKIWMGTEEGVSIFDTKTQTFSNIRPNRREPFGLSHKSVRSICMAKNGIIWLGTFQGGVNKLDPNLALFNLKHSSPFDPKGLRSPIVTSFVEHNKGKLFIGTDGGGVHSFDRNTGLFEHINVKSKIDKSGNPLAILALELDNRGFLWIGTYQDGLFSYNVLTKSFKQFLAGPLASDLSQNDIFFVKEDSRGMIWIGTNGNGVNVYNPKTNLFTRYGTYLIPPMLLPSNGYMRAISEDVNGDIWLASNGTGIAVYQYKTGKFKLYNKANSGLSNDVVLSLLHDSKGNLWAGTDGGGLDLFDSRTGKFTNFNESNGLPSPIVYKILEDKAGVIWFSTDRGISSLNPKTKKIKNFGRPNGLQDSPFVLGSGLTTSEGELYFGGQEGFNYFYPTDLPGTKTAPSVLLTELKVANIVVLPSEKSPIKEQIGFAKKIHLTYGQNFSISYTALNYTAPEQNNYSYRLVGLENKWNYVEREKTAYYTNLDPGNYTFQVRASNNDGSWSDQITSISVYVQPPLWRTVYAYVFYVIAIGAILFAIRRRGIQRIKRQLALEQEQINIQQKILQQQREAERAHALDIQKIKFLTNLSHEFRTPISLILAPVDKLLSTKQDQYVSSQVKMIKRNARRLLNLVNQLLDFRKMEEQELKLNLSQGDLILFVKEAAEAFQDLSERKKISLQVSSDAPSLQTYFDQDKMERIIFNLLSNAFKFTPEGGTVSLRMSLQTTPSHSKPIFDIAVSDTGIGIAPESKVKVFDRFFMGNNVSSILNQGSGIGLSIVKEFIELHGGEITLESELGKGSTFLVSLPVEIIEREEIIEEENGEHLVNELADFQSEVDRTSAVADGKIATVLLVEDNEEFRFHLRDSLQPYYQIIEASNGKEGWQKTLSGHPQLVVSDISMPEMNGIELSQKIKADKRTSHIPVILLTAISGEEDQIIGLKSGANDYLTKPFNFDILQAKIENLLLFNRSVKNAYSKQVKVESKEIEIESSEVKLLSKIVKYIDEKLNNPELSVEELSKHVGMSRGSLYHKLLEITGLTPIEYIRSVKLERAVELLEKSDYNVAQIAYMTGFGTPSYFSRLFKAQFNMLPSEYINAKRKDKRDHL
ncbi:two-component regulator propeller domain-containing protein [Pedobacter frigiditerrae]|uniref:hybrid sensor histidine kinase/response regulator transcription factor n=1 Tax=Pedobacter frigiditerrae TaxID=2530452 RepID=UPI00292D1CCB|nr:two-component regulator propeller domain-containing protein [Pedobacter frigiditerrae]